MRHTITEQKIRRITVTQYDEDMEIAHGSVLIDKKPTGKLAGLIEDIWTHEGYRKQGIGRQIVAELIEIARDLGCYKCVLSCNDHNVRFYEHIGFRKHENTMRLDLEG